MNLTEAERRRFTAVFEDADLRDVRGRGFVRVLFVNCVFKDMRRAHFVNCFMENCRLETDDPRDLLEVTMTLNCHTFKGMRLEGASLDAMLYMVLLGSPPERARAIRAAIDPAKLALYERIFPTLDYCSSRD